MSVKCQVIMDAMEKLAPRYLAEEWDNVGLLLGNPAQDIGKIMLALDITSEVAEMAACSNVDLIITHHPLLFKSIKYIRTDLPQGKLLRTLMKADIAVYTSHTNLDIADQGVNDILCRNFALENVESLTVGYTDKICKLAVFVPITHTEAVRMAITDAGAGYIGDYSHCTFQTSGIGTFLPLPGTNPYIGQQGKLEYVEEARLETILPERILKKVLKAMHKAHPYEEVAYDVFPVQNMGKTYGLGRIGKLSSPKTLAEFAQQVKKSLSIPNLRVVGELDKIVKKVALCGGSGASLIHKAAFAGADVLVTGDVKYHEAQEAAAMGLAVIDGGHFATEVPVIAYLQQYLSECAVRNRWGIDINMGVQQDLFAVL